MNSGEEKISGTGEPRAPAVLVESQEKAVIGTNQAFRNIFGLENPSVDQILNIVAPGKQEEFRRFIEGKNSKTAEIEAEAKTLNGIRNFRLRKNPLENSEKDFFYVEFRSPERDRLERLESLHCSSFDFLRAESRDEVFDIAGEIICDELGFEDIILRERRDGELVLRYSSGDAQEEGACIKFSGEATPASEAFRTGKTVHHRSRNGDSSKTVVHVPIGKYGVISASTTGFVENFEVKLLRLLAGTADFVMKSLEHEGYGKNSNRTGTELTLRSEEDKFFLSRLSRDSGLEFTIEKVMPSSNGGEIYYIESNSSDAGNVEAMLLNTEAVKKCKVLNDSDSGSRFKLKNRSETFFSRVMERGGVVKNCRSTPEEFRVVIETSSEDETVGIFEVFRERNSSWELTGKKKIERNEKDEMQENRKLGEKLTEKQMKALKKAYRTGYYSHPRKSTAEEVANSLGISDSTLFQHLQAAQRKLIEEFLETGEQRIH